MKLIAFILVLASAALGSTLATQTVAHALDYAPELGTPWLELETSAVYAPWAWLLWADTHEPRSPEAFSTASLLTAGITAAGSALATVLRFATKRPTQSTSHGSARWAETAELRRAGLLKDAGVVLCQTDDATYITKTSGKATHTVAKRFGKLVTHDGPEHLICFAPTRSGKGVGLVIPTLLSWRNSVIVHDIKRENWFFTAGWRQLFSHVWRFEPTAIDSVRFNPLLEVRKGELEVKDTQNIADILIDPTGEKERLDHWELSAHSLLCGAILHVLYAEPDKTLAGVAALLSDPKRPQLETLQRMLTTRHLEDGPHPLVAQVARQMLNKTDRELSGVVSSTLTCLGLYRDPIIARNTAHSDFRITDIMNAERPVSLYLVVPPNDISRTRPLIRLVLNQLARRLTESMEFGGKPAYRHRLLLLLDEFPALGRLDFFETGLAFWAGYGIKALLIAQSLNQLEKAYGPNNSILDNCHVRLTYAANDDKTARRISELLGQATEHKTQKGRSGSGIFLSNRSETEQEFARPLLTPAEVNQLPQDDAILLVGGLPPYRGRKIRYYLDSRFRRRASLPRPDSAPEQRRELLTLTPSEWELLPLPPEPAVLQAQSAAAPHSSPASNSTPEDSSSFRGPPSDTDPLSSNKLPL